MEFSLLMTALVWFVPLYIVWRFIKIAKGSALSGSTKALGSSGTKSVRLLWGVIALASVIVVFFFIFNGISNLIAPPTGAERPQSLRFTVLEGAGLGIMILSGFGFGVWIASLVQERIQLGATSGRLFVLILGTASAATAVIVARSVFGFG